MRRIRWWQGECRGLWHPCLSVRLFFDAKPCTCQQYRLVARQFRHKHPKLSNSKSDRSVCGFLNRIRHQEALKIQGRIQNLAIEIDSWYLETSLARTTCTNYCCASCMICKFVHTSVAGHTGRSALTLERLSRTFRRFCSTMGEARLLDQIQWHKD